MAERIGGRPNFLRSATYALLSLAAGAGVHYLLKNVTARRHLRTTDDIRNQLGMPVVSLVGQQSIEASEFNLERAFRRSVLVAEILLLVLALTAFSLVSTQRQLAGPVALDPLGAVAESLDRTLSPTLRR